MSGPPHPISPPPGAAPPASTGVRRHHTITATSRTARAAGRNTISEEAQEQQAWNDDEVVDQEWVGAVGAVGEKGGSLHRQSSLPTRYNRAYGQGQAGNSRTMNSLSAIAGQEGEEEDWEREMRGLRNDDDVRILLTQGPRTPPLTTIQGLTTADHPQHQQVMETHSQSSSGSPLSPHFATIPSPPPGNNAGGVRRHQSLTYGAATGGPRRMAPSGLKRAGTLQTQIRAPGQAPQTPSPTNADEEFVGESTTGHEDESYFNSRQGSGQQGQYPTSPIGRSPWSTPSNEWRTPGGSHVGSNNNSNVAIDDVQRALSSLDINNQQNPAYQGNYPGGQSAHPPRFNPSHPPPQHAPGMRTPNGGNGSHGSGRKLQLVTDLDERKANMSG
ncbi:hypothetical protein EVG20_g10308, partial [Dentipellis fragilis]